MRLTVSWQRSASVPWVDDMSDTGNVRQRAAPTLAQRLAAAWQL